MLRHAASRTGRHHARLCPLRTTHRVEHFDNFRSFPLTVGAVLDRGVAGSSCVGSSFYERPILNSPYQPPSLHHPLDDNGQPLEGEPIAGRRPSKFIVPVPASRKKASAAQASLDLEETY